mgnify:CR=1 FL=1|tara:strand:- start:3434 stop:5134 length:1701 start_codon:yes stop_codon:yes gene_type:complete
MTKAVQFNEVSKKFELRHSRDQSFFDLVTKAVGRNTDDVEQFWALKEVTFEVEAGETLGIIGRNGSGKSTILKLLSGTLKPDLGRVDVEGRVFGLLELGAGFHPDLSGRENIFLNGAFLGIDRQQMESLYDSIVTFAELEQFIDTPIKHYSSGMYMRLGFSIAIAVRPDVLLIDEVLAVGDAAFARKCYDALAVAKRDGRTMLFVSHDPILVRRFCDRVLWIEEGRVVQCGLARDVIQSYLQHVGGPTSGEEYKQTAGDEGGEEGVVLSEVMCIDESGNNTHTVLPGASIRIRMSYSCTSVIEDVVFGCSVSRSDGLHVFESSSIDECSECRLDLGSGQVELSLGSLHMGPGVYKVSVGVWQIGNEEKPLHVLRQVLTLYMGRSENRNRGAIFMHSRWGIKKEENDSFAGTNLVRIPQPDMTTLPYSLAWSHAPECLQMGNGEDEYLGSGWYPVENWPPEVRWMGSSACAVITQDVGKGTLVIRACRPLHREASADGRVLLNGQEITRFRLSGMDFEDLAIPLTPVNQPTRLEVVIEIDKTFVPDNMGIDPDTRELGIAIREIRVE